MPTKNIKKSYDKMYEEKVETKEAAPAEESVVEEAPAEETIKEPKEAKTFDKIPATKPFMGVVTGGLGLNVRKTPNGEVIHVIPDGAQVRVLDDSDHDWYKIESPEGFVMKKFIKKG